MIDIQNTILGKIVDRKHEELATRLKQRSLHDVEQWAKKQHQCVVLRMLYNINVQPLLLKLKSITF